MTNLIPYTTREHAQTRALERRAWLSAQLRERRDFSLPWQVLERPQHASPIEPEPLHEAPQERFGQLARLLWQMNATTSLLLERVTDLLVPQVLATRKGAPLAPFAAKLSPLPPGSDRRLFPWRAVVCTHDRHSVSAYLKEHADWLGIGIDLEEPSATRFSGRCQVGYEGLTGLVGGAVEGDALYALTCRHVISSTCRSIAPLPYGPPGPLPSVLSNAPDAVLLNSDIPCFRTPPQNAVPYSAASTGFVEQQMLKRLPVVQNHPEVSRRTVGVVKSVVSATIVEGRLMRGPLIEIIPLRTAYLFGLLHLPLRATDFSTPGDSGGWVVDAASSTWLGVITAGDDRGSTYATSADFLVRFFRLQLAGQSDLSATSWATL